MEKAKANMLAEKIARMLDTDAPAASLSSIEAGIQKINERLDLLEARLEPAVQVSSPPKSVHPSTEHFSIIEAFADEIIGNINKEKACAFEPNGKPCDHCSMCSSRGF